MPISDPGSLVTLWLQLFLIVSAASLVSTGLGMALEGVFRTRTQILSVAVRDGQLQQEIASYAVFILILTTCAALWLSTGWVVFGATGAGQAALTFAVLWTAFEIYYYGLHRALHSRVLYRFHAHHHESRVTTSWTGQSLGLVDLYPTGILPCQQPPGFIRPFLGEQPCRLVPLACWEWE